MNKWIIILVVLLTTLVAGGWLVASNAAPAETLCYLAQGCGWRPPAPMAAPAEYTSTAAAVEETVQRAACVCCTCGQQPECACCQGCTSKSEAGAPACACGREGCPEACAVPTATGKPADATADAGKALACVCCTGCQACCAEGANKCAGDCVPKVAAKGAPVAGPACRPQAGTAWTAACAGRSHCGGPAPAGGAD